MPRTFLRQVSQIRNSDTYDDTLAAGATLETTPTNLEEDLNGLRSQVNRVIDATGTGNWYDPIPTVNSKTRAILQLNTDLDDLEEKRFLFRTQVITDITVPAAQNWVVLSVAGSEAPTPTAAVGAVTTTGTVVAQATTFDAHNLDEVAGPNAIRPKNLLFVRDADTGDPILSGSKQVYALIQSESGVDGHTFDDATQQVQLSFVIENATADDLIACPVGDIATQDINYSYVQRLDFDSLPEEAFLNGIFVDQVASSDVTLQNAINNQLVPANQGQDIEVRIADTFTWDFTDSTGVNTLFSVAPNAGNDVVTIGGDSFNSTATSNSFNNSLSVDTSGTQIDIGVNAGAIETTGSDDLTINGAGELYFDDGNQTGSTWAQTQGIKLSETTAEWNTFETNFGEVSLLNAINQVAATAGGVTLDDAIDNQGATPATQTTNIFVDITDGSGWNFRNSAGSETLLSITPGAVTDTVSFNVDAFAVDNSSTATFTGGIQVSTGGAPVIGIGDTSGTIDSAAALTVEATTVLNLEGQATGRAIYFLDGNETGSTWPDASGIPFSAAQAEWNSFFSNFGNVSLIDAINQANTSAARTKGVSLVTSAIAADTDLAGGTNIDVALPDYSTVTFVTDVDVYLNGVLQRNGANAAANHDVYPGTTPASGHIRFEYPLVVDDQVTMIVYGA